jgi:uncharacterized membrane protein
MTYDPGPTQASSDSNKTLTVILYALSLAGFVTGITAFVALIIALVKKADVRGTIYESHLDLIIWTNIWAVVAFIAVTIVGTVLLIVLIGAAILWLGYLAVAVWYGARLILGLIKLMDNRPIDNPRGFLF